MILEILGLRYIHNLFDSKKQLCIIKSLFNKQYQLSKHGSVISADNSKYKSVPVVACITKINPE